MLTCPKCDKGLSHAEVTVKRCNTCGLEFDVAKPVNVGPRSDHVLLQTFINESRKRNKNFVNYYETVINFIKAYFPHTICWRFYQNNPDKTYARIYLIKDQEVMGFLFRIRRVLSYAFVEFDIHIDHTVENVKPLKKRTNQTATAIKSFIKTKDLEVLMPILQHVYNRKLNRYKIMPRDAKGNLYVRR